MYKNRYFKNPFSQLASFIGITTDLDYTAQTTLANFIANSVKAGDIGIFNASSGALISGLGAVSTSLPIVIAVNTGLMPGSTTKYGFKVSPSFKVADLSMVRTPYVAPVLGSRTMVFNAASAVATGDILTLKILDLTAGSHPLQSNEWSYTVKAGDTFDGAMQKLTDAINDQTSVQNAARDQLVSAAYTAGTNTLAITNLDYGVVTKVFIPTSSKLASFTIDTDTIVKTVLGSGFPAEVKLLEEAMAIGQNISTNYPMAGTAPVDYGLQTSVVDYNGAGAQYNYYTFKTTRSDSSKIPGKRIDLWADVIFLAVNANATAKAEEEIKAIFGL